jgi:hypothetical protein
MYNGLINIKEWHMLKKEGTRRPFGSTIDKKIGDKITEYSNETDIPISRILDKAMQMYLDSVKKDKPGK